MKRLILAGALALLVAGTGCEATKAFAKAAGEAAVEQAKKDPPSNWVELINLGLNALVAGVSAVVGGTVVQTTHVVKRRRAAKKALKATV